MIAMYDNVACISYDFTVLPLGPLQGARVNGAF